MKQLNRLIACLLVAVLLTSPTVLAKQEEAPLDSMVTYYVAMDGDDTAAGTATAPFATLQRALQAAREGSPANTVIYVKAGRYFFDTPLELSRVDSGLTIRACEGEKVVFSGAKDLGKPAWQDYPANPHIKVAQIEPHLGIDQLFVDQTNQILARYPNFEEGKLPLGGAATRAEIKGRVANYANPAGGYLRAIHAYGWGGNDYIITGKDPSNPTGLQYQWVGDNNRGHDMQDAVVVENLFEELDAPGEWYYDSAAGLLYYYPAEGVDLSSCTLEAAVTSQLVTITGEDPAHPVTDITIDGIQFFGTKRTMFTVEQEGKAYIPLLRGDWCVVRAGAVYLENARKVTLKHCGFYSMGGNGVFFYGYNDSNRVENSDFVDIGATAIQVVGSSNAVYEPSFWPHAHYPQLQVHKTSVSYPDKVGPRTEDYPRDIVIYNNHIENVGVFEKQSSGVNVSVSSRIKILRNTIHKSARSGININDGTFGGHEIAYNDVYDCQRETTDHGQFNSWGRDRFWSVPRYNAAGESGNLLRHYIVNGVEYDITRIDAYQTTTIHDNRFHHDTTTGSTWGIDLDDGSSNYEIYNNLCLGMGIKLREGFDRKVYNNIILDGQLQIHVSYADARDELRRNLVLHSTPYGFASVDEARFKNAEYIVDHNWYYNFDRSVILPAWFAANKPSNPYDANALIGVEPRFADPYANNYTVTNTEAMEQIGFENFPMDQFGQIGCPCQSPYYIKVSASPGSSDQLQRQRWRGATISNIDDAIMSATAYAGHNGVFFEEVPEDSEAYRMGFRTRDIVKSVNGQAVTNKISFLDLFDAIEVGERVVLELHRTNDTTILEFVKRPPEELLLECDDPAIRYSNNGAGWGNHREEEDISEIGVRYNTGAGAWFEVDFTGVQITYYSRRYTDQGEFQVTILDRDTGQVVLQETGTAYSTERAYGAAVYTSPELPQGNYTLRVQKLNGEYLIVDAFLIRRIFSEEPDGLPGDVDGNGAITTTDARLTLQYAVGKISAGNLNTAVADVNGDEAITATDARLILQKAVGKINEFPIRQ